MIALAALLAVAAAAQSPAPYGSPEPAPDPAPAVSTAAVAASSAPAPSPGDGVHIAGDAPKPKLKRPIKAVIPKEAADWEPVGLKEGGDPHQASTGVTLKLVRTAKGATKGERSKAKAVARAYQAKSGETWLIVAVFPKALEARRKHLEVRLRVVEGNVEKVEAALVTVTDRRAFKELDKVALRRAGAAFEEENPGSGLVLLSALEPRPGKTSWNAGKLSLAAFADPTVGYADVSWSARGVETSTP